jgi:hypothetical protein
LDGLREKLWFWLRDGDHYGHAYARLFGLVIDDSEAPPTVYRKGDKNGYDIRPTVEVHAVRPAIRRTIQGSSRTDLVVEITQRRRGYFKPEEQKEKDSSPVPLPQDERGDFTYRAGCTILIDLKTQKVRRVIRTFGRITDDHALERVRKFLCGETGVSGNAFDAGLALSLSDPHRAMRDEPFALLHLLED